VQSTQECYQVLSGNTK